MAWYNSGQGHVMALSAERARYSSRQGHLMALSAEKHGTAVGKVM